MVGSTGLTVLLNVYECGRWCGVYLIFWMELLYWGQSSNIGRDLLHAAQVVMSDQKSTIHECLWLYRAQSANSASGTMKIPPRGLEN